MKTPYYIEPGMLGRNGKVKPKHPNYIQLNGNSLALIGHSHGINDLTTYYARYTWSTIASSIGILQDTISHALGHIQNETTEGYINYNLNLIDTANLKVIQAISYCPE